MCKRECGGKNLVGNLNASCPRRVPWANPCKTRQSDCRHKPLGASSPSSYSSLSHAYNHFLLTLLATILLLSLMAFKLPPAAKPLLRAQLTSRPANGAAHFIPQCRKLVFEYCNKWPSSANTRTFLNSHLEELARSNPHVEVVVKPRPNHEPIVRGFYSALHFIPALYVTSDSV